MRKLALLVGINRYEPDAFEDLSCCEADAEDVERLLSHHQPVDEKRTGVNNSFLIARPRINAIPIVLLDDGFESS